VLIIFSQAYTLKTWWNLMHNFLSNAADWYTSQQTKAENSHFVCDVLVQK